MTNFWLILYHFAVGFLMAFIGLMSPGMLTMSTLNAAIDRGTKSAAKFALGAALPIFIQAHLALLGAGYIKEHPQILTNFSKIAVFVFFVLAIVFFKQYRQRKLVIHTPRFSINNSFWYGVFISTINPMAIPFYFTYSTLLELQGWLTIKEPFITAFVLGAVLGAYTILNIYGKNAPKLMSKLQFVSKNFKLILALIMFVLGLVALMHVLKIY
jgi:threonine/homoserine/homoserine lactone efflux protein